MVRVIQHRFSLKPTMTANSAAEKLARLSRGLIRAVITEREFSTACVGFLIDEPTHDPIPLLLELPDDHRALILAEVVEFSKIDYCLPSHDGSTDEWQRQRQSEARIVCDAILAHFKPRC